MLEFISSHHSAGATKPTDPGGVTFSDYAQSGIMPGSSRTVMKERVNPPRGFRTDTIDLHQIRDRGALDRLERAEVVQ
jgi:hypothetical protein